MAFWCERYRGRDELGAIPVASSDVDFYGGPKAAKQCAAKLRGKVDLAEPFGHSPNTALVTFADSAGQQREIDFLRVVFGLKNENVREKSLLIEDEHEGEKFRLRVLNPIMVLRSRVANVAELSGGASSHGLSQLRAALLCANEFLRELLGAGLQRDVFRNNEVILKLACSRSGRHLYERHGLDVFDAVLIDESLGHEFMTKRLPQMRRHLQLRRGSD